MSTKSQTERILQKQGKADKKTALQMEKRAKALAITDAVTGTAMAIATPAVATALGVTAATAGAASLTAASALAVVFPIGTIIAAIPLTIGLGFSIAGKSKKRRAKFLTKDQDLLLKLVKRYKKRKTNWRQKKAERLLKRYNRHLKRGNKRTVALLDGNKKRKHKMKWKGKKAKLEMQMTAIYMAQYEAPPPKKKVIVKKSDQKKNNLLTAVIQESQRESIEPILSPFRVQNGKVHFDQNQMKKQTIRMLQRPSEMSDAIALKPPAMPQPISLTLKQSPNAVPEEVNWLLVGGIGAGLLATLVVGATIYLKEDETPKSITS